MRLIPLSQGYFAVVDDSDYDAVSAFKWCVSTATAGLPYAVRAITLPDGRRSTQRMHRFLLPGDAEVDHWDGNSLNNTRGNLRVATSRQNKMNRGKTAGCTSPFKGVTWHKPMSKWKGQIKLAGKNYHLGYFSDDKEAARVYDAKATELFGKFARLNFNTPTP